MTCPKCGGRVTVKDVVQTSENHTYRKKKCNECGLIFYTSEEIVPFAGEFKAEWNANYRKGKV